MLHRLVALFLLAVFSCQVSAGITVDVGDYLLLPDTADQVVEITVSTDTSDTIALMNFLAEVSGPPNNPLISEIDFDSESGLLFFGNSDGYVSSFSNGSIEQGSITVATLGSEVLAQGNIRVLIDTTGILSGGVWSFSLTDIAGNPQNDSSFADQNAAPVAAIFSNGSLTVIPEPSSALLVALVTFVCCRRRH
ncbi:MAG: hypothetical protein AAGH99_05305 [Planctomycetota bacterium]